ncbi:ABC transporter substrate-binding protein [Halobacillus shinanisalinarum]|uniref:ABC transporter substrate-binding protein n=1 Tax=Halobacillus shinanisalinarum TaxID=2932258 RepID=A0ABY4GUX9_9BACI|nr:ABC transporter substrate-binding protein [Halobacillus shinanisalinarum]UOQ91824.1 ABC transporter substrate-binding protein [Halobacillus shinanisalinarum]
MKERKILLLFISLLVTLFIVGCSGDSMSSKDSGGGKENSEGKEEILLWHYYTGSEEILVDLQEKFNESQDDIELNLEYIPFSDMKKQLAIGSAGDTLPDLIISDTVDNASLASMGVLEDITDRIDEWGQTDKFLKGPMDSTVFKGRNYGLPITSNALGLFYNKAKLEEAGISEPPSNWNELKESANKLTTESQKGIGISAVKSEESTFQFYPFLYSAGGNYKELGDEKAIDALRLIDDLMEKGFMSQDVLNSTQDDLTRKFSAGEIGMMVNGPWIIDRLKEESPDLDFGITPIPKNERFSSVLGGDNMALIKDGNVDAAWKFMTWLLEPEQLEEFAVGTGYFPPRKDVLNQSDYWKNDEHLSEFIPIMETAEARGPSPEWPEISEAIQNAIQEALTDTKTPKEALEDASTKVQEITQE